MLHYVLDCLRWEKEKEIFRKTEIKSHKKNGQETRAKYSEFEGTLIPLSINTKLIYKTSHISTYLLNFTCDSDQDNDLEGSGEFLDLFPER